MVAMTIIVAKTIQNHNSLDIGNKNENHEDFDPLKT